jgi:2-keto-4-pentenoate hydratase/2-oxohepta-3-ene-1,7-dioic acid hydratase in catechol pathway
MHWCRFMFAGQASFGRIAGERIQRVEGTPFDAPRATGDSVPLAGAQLLPPVLPFTFFCVGLNYRAHILHVQAKGMAAAKIPERPEIGYRANNALIGHGEPIVMPSDFHGQLEAEGEVVAIIGRKSRRASRAEAADAIFGWTIGNDVSAREWQRADRTFWRSKNSDTFKPMGPWIVTGLDPDDLRVTIRLNGREMFSYAVKDALFGVRQFITRMSQYLTLYPGDVLWMGTDGATENMTDGDVVEVEITDIGVLRNPVVRER